MTTIKSFTDISQSKKLTEILPFESADMYYPTEWTSPKFGVALSISNNIPCWSLAALLYVLPKTINHETLFVETSAALWHIGYRNIYTARADNPIDACYELILKLDELKLL